MRKLNISNLIITLLLVSPIILNAQKNLSTTSEHDEKKNPKDLTEQKKNNIEKTPLN